MRGWCGLASMGVLAMASQAWALTINPTFVNNAAGTWDATEIAVVNQAISDWTGKIADDHTVNVTLDFTNAGTGSYLGQWSGSYSGAFVGDDIYPWQKASHTIHFNASLMTGTNYLWFDPTPATANDQPFEAWDALSVARHEIGHMLGFTSNFYKLDVGTATPVNLWDSHITTVAGNPVFDAGTINARMAASNNLAHVFDGGSTADDLMVPSILNGVRRDISMTDLSMMQSAYGYTLVPEPGIVLLAAGSFALALIRPRRNHQA